MTEINRVKVGFFIDQAVVENFRRLIMQKYQKYEKGILSYEVENALRYWLSLHTNAQTQTLRQEQIPNPTPKVSIIMAQIKNYLLEKYYFELRPGQQVPTAHLREAISAVRGSDERTIAKWLRVLHRMGLVKPVTSATWEVI